MKGLLDSEPVLADVWVRGEISNFRHHSSGHMYFTLKDSVAQIRAVMFRGDNQRLLSRGPLFRPTDGLKIIARGHVSVYERDGQYQLYVREMQPDGVGSLYLAFEQLKAKLAAEGLFDQAAKRELPLVPRRVGVVTSPTGAALRDIITVARRRYPNVHLVLSPAAVQGEGAAADLIRALGLLDQRDDIDVIILARGGGSIEELWAFNDEGLARAIRAARHPVVTGVGHETDVTIADLAADRRAATPSSAAELVVPAKAELARAVGVLTGRLERACRGFVDRRREAAAKLAAAAVLSYPERLLEARRQRVDDLAADLRGVMERFLERLRLRRDALAGRLDALSPLAILTRGYALCRRSDDGRVVSSVTAVAPGERVDVLVSDGRLECDVRAVEGGVVGPEGGE